MKALRVLLLAAVAASAAFGAAPRLYIGRIGTMTGSADPGQADATLFQLATGVGALAPSDPSGNPEWPCFTGDAADWPDCSSIWAAKLGAANVSANVTGSSGSVVRTVN